MAGSLSQRLTLQQQQRLGAIGAAEKSDLTTPELTRLHIHVNGPATNKAVRRLQARGLVVRSAQSPITGAIIWAATSLR